VQNPDRVLRFFSSGLSPLETHYEPGFQRFKVIILIPATMPWLSSGCSLSWACRRIAVPGCGQAGFYRPYR